MASKKKEEKKFELPNAYDLYLRYINEKNKKQLDYNDNRNDKKLNNNIQNQEKETNNLKIIKSDVYINENHSKKNKKKMFIVLMNLKIVI